MLSKAHTYLAAQTLHWVSSYVDSLRTTPTYACSVYSLECSGFRSVNLTHLSPSGQFLRPSSQSPSDHRADPLTGETTQELSLCRRRRRHDPRGGGQTSPATESPVPRRVHESTAVACRRPTRIAPQVLGTEPESPVRGRPRADRTSEQSNKRVPRQWRAEVGRGTVGPRGRRG